MNRGNKTSNWEQGLSLTRQRTVRTARDGTQNFPKQCGCKGDGCDDVIWGRNIAHPLTGEEDYYTYYDDDDYLNKDGSYNLDKIYDAVGTLGESGYTTPLNNCQIILEKTNFLSYSSICNHFIVTVQACYISSE